MAERKRLLRGPLVADVGCVDEEIVCDRVSLYRSWEDEGGGGVADDDAFLTEEDTDGVGRGGGGVNNIIRQKSDRPTKKRQNWVAACHY